jgi:N-acetylglucosaminyl-diphospho-decaprenol L-rhamnosyltransferase
MDVSVIIVSRNTRVLLAESLASVVADSDRLAVEVSVVDNASTDGSVEMVRDRFPQAHLIANSENVGFARANNQALVEATGQYLLLLNSDARLAPGSLTELIRWADNKPKAGIVGVKLLNPNGSFQAAWNRFPTPISAWLEPWGLWAWLTRNPYYPSCPPDLAVDARPCDWVGGACLLARAEAVRQVGYLDERFFLNGEEVDWCYRMHQAGWQVWYTPSIEVVHHGGASGNRKEFQALARLYHSKVAFIGKHYGRLTAEVLVVSLRLSALAKAGLWLMRSILLGKPPDSELSRALRAVALRSWPCE